MSSSSSSSDDAAPQPLELRVRAFFPTVRDFERRENGDPIVGSLRGPERIEARQQIVRERLVAAAELKILRVARNPRAHARVRAQRPRESPAPAPPRETEGEGGGGRRSARTRVRARAFLRREARERPRAAGRALTRARRRPPLARLRARPRRQEQLRWCYHKEGVNHYENCKSIADQVLERLRKPYWGLNRSAAREY